MQWDDQDGSRPGDGAVDDNPIEQLDDLPDKLLLGLRLVIIGILFLGTNYFWQRYSPASFTIAAAIFVKYVGWVALLVRRNHTRLTLPVFLLLSGTLFEICGVFIFIRRIVWRVEDRLPKRVLELNLEGDANTRATGTKQDPPTYP